MAPDSELIEAIGHVFRSDATLLALLGGRFFAVAPDKAAALDDAGAAYATVGPVTGAPVDAECSAADEVTLQLDLWFPNRDEAGCRAAVARLRRLLHDTELPLVTNALATLEVALTRVLTDPDQITLHGVVQLTATIELP